MSELPSLAPIDPELEAGYSMLGVSDPYSSQVKELYLEATKAYEDGADLEQYLRTITFWTSGMMRTELNLTPRQLQFVLEDRQTTRDSRTYYDARLVHAQQQLFKWMLDEVYGEQTPSQTYSEEFNHDTTFTPHRLDETFDGIGSRRGGLDDIHYVMFAYGLKVDSVELTRYFTHKLTNSERRVDAYFLASATQAASSGAALDLIGDLRQELEATPRELCRFLLREVEENTTGEVSENTHGIMVLSASSEYFSDIERDLLRAYLAETLVRKSQTEIAKLVHGGSTDLTKILKAEVGTQAPAKQGFLKQRKNKKATRMLRGDKNGLMETAMIIANEHCRENPPLVLPERPVGTHSVRAKPYTVITLARRATTMPLDVYQELMADPRETSLAKLVGAVAMAGQSRDDADHESVLGTSLFAELELFKAEIDSNRAQSFGVIARTAAELDFQRRREILKQQISAIRLPETRKKLTERLRTLT